MDKDLGPLAKLSKSLKELGEHPKQISKLVDLLRDLDAEEVGLIADCLSELSALKRPKRLALWRSLKVFLEE